MKKLFILLLSALSLTAVAEPKKVAVYVTGDDAGINKVLGNKLVSAIGRDEKYSVIERTDDFLAAIAKEQSYQRTGAVDDEEISKIGKQFGVEFVCVTTINNAFDIPYISARMIDVETAEIEGAANCSNKLTSGKDVMNIGDTLANRLLESLSSEKVLAWKKVAVYITPSKTDKNLAHILGDVLVAGFSNKGRYVAIERTNTFLSQLYTEQEYQRKGAVNENEISRLGKQMGVNYVCVADITEVLGEKYISARMIDVETAKIINMNDASGKIDNIDDCIEIANEIVQPLLKGTYEEQLYEDANYSGFYNYYDVLNHGELSKVNIPDWFMNIPENTFVGISMPQGDELDAISMALIQKILASDESFLYESFYFNSDSLHEQTKKNTRQHEEFHMEFDSTQLSIETTLRYQIQELAKLPNGEYICRLTNGNRNRLRIKIVYDYFLKGTRLDTASMLSNEINLYLEYSNRKCNFHILRYGNGDGKKFTESYISKYEKEFFAHQYLFMNNNVVNVGETKENNMPYIFPISRVSENQEIKQYTFRFDSEKCLAEQLLEYYMRVMVATLPHNYSFYGIKRQKTPIISQQYDKGKFIITTAEQK